MRVVGGGKKANPAIAVCLNILKKTMQCCQRCRRSFLHTNRNNLYRFLDQEQPFRSRKKEERKTEKEKVVEEYSYVNDREFLLTGKIQLG